MSTTNNKQLATKSKADTQQKQTKSGNFTWGLTLLTVGILLLLIAAILFPLATIWALNLLFHLNIPYNFYTWLAMMVLIFTIQGALNIRCNKR